MVKEESYKVWANEDCAVYTALRNSVNKEIRLAKKRFYQFYRSQINDATGDQRTPWKVLNDLLGKKSSNNKIAELKPDSGVTVTEPEKLSDYRTFCSDWPKSRLKDSSR